MKVILKKDNFVNTSYECDFDIESLIFKNNEERIEIKVDELKGFNLSGKEDIVKYFVLETNNKLYEGQFLSSDDAKSFITMLSKLKPCYVDVNLNLY